MSLTTLLLAVLGTIVSVTDQSSFDRLQERVDSVLQTSTEELVVAFSPGVYFYREGQLHFSGLDRPELTHPFFFCVERPVYERLYGGVEVVYLDVEAKTRIREFVRNPYAAVDRPADR